MSEAAADGGDGMGVGDLASLALALEVSVTPKPGSVDRDHDFPDTGFRHFLASAAAVREPLQGAFDGGLSVGESVLRCVERFRAAQSGGNTHLGAVTLLAPLATGGGLMERVEFDGPLFEAASAAVEEASVDDAAFYMDAVRLAGAGGLGEREELDASAESGASEVREKGITFLELMEMSEEDDVAMELVKGFPRTARAADGLAERLDEKAFEEAASETFVEIGAEGDSFVRKRHGEGTYRRVRARFREVVDSGFDRWLLGELDRELNYEGINPGSTADLLGAAIFVNLLWGWRP